MTRIQNNFLSFFSNHVSFVERNANTEISFGWELGMDDFILNTKLKPVKENKWTFSRTNSSRIKEKTYNTVCMCTHTLHTLLRNHNKMCNSNLIFFLTEIWKRHPKCSLRISPISSMPSWKRYPCFQLVNSILLKWLIQKINSILCIKILMDWQPGLAIHWD